MKSYTTDTNKELDDNNEKWPFDEPVTQEVFSFLPGSDLLSLALACRFFRVNAKEIATQRLKKEFAKYNISDTLLDDFSHLALLRRLEIFKAEFHEPIATCLPPAFISKLTSEHQEFHVSKDAAVLSVCKKKDETELYLVGTFGYLSDNVLNISQFSVRITEKGCVDIKRLTNEEGKTLKLEVLQDKDFAVIFSIKKSQMIKILTQICLTFIKKEITSFEQLFSDLLDFAGINKSHGSLKPVMLSVINNFTHPTNELAL